MSIPEFSFIIKLDELHKNKGQFTIQAKEEERLSLAKRLGLEGLKYFSCKFYIEETTNRSFEYEVNGDANAILVQKCVNTFDLIEKELNFSFKVYLKYGEESADEDYSEDVEYIQSNAVDIGEIASQYLSLEVDQFPKLESLEIIEDKENMNVHRPFEVLSKKGKKD